MVRVSCCKHTPRRSHTHTDARTHTHTHTCSLTTLWACSCAALLKSIRWDDPTNFLWVDGNAARAQAMRHCQTLRLCTETRRGSATRPCSPWAVKSRRASREVGVMNTPKRASLTDLARPAPGDAVTAVPQQAPAVQLVVKYVLCLVSCCWSCVYWRGLRVCCVCPPQRPARFTYAALRAVAACRGRPPAVVVVTVMRFVLPVEAQPRQAAPVPA